MMDPKAKTKWVKALRGRKYKQANGILRNDVVGVCEGFCCLGVLCDVLGAEWKHNGSVPYVNGHRASECGLTLGHDFRAQVGIPKRTEKILINMNDGCRGRKPKTFKQIAKYIETRL